MLEKWTAPITTKIVCVADAMREQSLAGGVGSPDQYVTIYSGMETAPFLNPPRSRQQVRQELGLKNDHVAVGTIARLFYLKGHEDLLELAPRLCARFPQLRFLWVGDGLLRGQLESQIQKMGLKERFILTGLVPPDRIPELTAAMDILVHPSRREGLARALAQGALAGKPVITYDIDGNREGLIHDQTGLLLPPFDRQKLSQSLAVLIEEPQLRENMGQRGRELALRRFDARVMVESLENLYSQELGKRQSKGT
jgi:glycosyltransferase involved in cell wall biosynthesis